MLCLQLSVIATAIQMNAIRELTIVITVSIILKALTVSDVKEGIMAMPLKEEKAAVGHARVHTFSHRTSKCSIFNNYLKVKY